MPPTNSWDKQKEQVVHIRPLKPRNRSGIEEMVVSSWNFNNEEIATALELVDEALDEGEEGHYIIVVLEDTKSHLVVQAYACYDPTPLTQGGYDLYWITANSKAQGREFGRLLLEYVERDVAKRGGRMLLIETSSQETYSATIRFYKRSGYELVIRIKDF